jgi:hypothetical protein
MLSLGRLVSDIIIMWYAEMLRAQEKFAYDLG